MTIYEPALRSNIEDLDGAVLPAQYFDYRQKKKQVEGERRLLVAVLEEAIRSYLATRKCRTARQRQTFAQLRRWFYASERGLPQATLSFESVCDFLDINADVIRKRLGSIGVRQVPTRREAVRPRYEVTRTRR
jgi:hypothetical protein